MDTSVDQLFKDREEAKQSPILEETTTGWPLNIPVNYFNGNVIN